MVSNLLPTSDVSCLIPTSSLPVSFTRPMKKFLVPLALFASLLPRAWGETAPRPFISPAFCDNMVLQRDQADPVWGWATPGESITVTLGGRTAKAVADSNGKWMAKLTPPPAGGPYELTIAGSKTVTFKNVLVGDVWICSGQSNMDFGMGMTLNAEQEIAQANQPQIRLLFVNKGMALTPVETFKGKWELCNPETVAAGGWKGFSAVAYFFGRELQANVKVPIGLIETSLGATPVETWISREALAKNVPDFNKTLDAIDQVDQMLRDGTFNKEKLQEEWYAKCNVLPEISTPGFDASHWKPMCNLPRNWGGAAEPELSGFEGAVWIRKEITLPEDAAGKEAELNFGCIDDGDVTWVNGHKVGATNGLAPRKYKVPAGVLKSGLNVIATWVINTGGGAGIVGKPEQLSLNIAGVAPISLAGDWQYQVGLPIDQLPPRLHSVWNNSQLPTEVGNYMIAPLIPFGIKGAIWYQGEANVGRAYQYRKLLPTLINDWRTRWQQGEFPFLIVQLANLGGAPKQPGESDWAELREAQSLAAQTVPNVGLVTAVDVGDPGDIHPANKQEVGRRLGLLARGQVYRQAVTYSGPVFKSLKVEGNEALVNFTEAKGLHAKNASEIKGFALAGPDHVFHWADAVIKGSSLVLNSPEVNDPVAVRYDWSNNPVGNLYNEADLPAFPFRTDDWPGITVNRK